MGKGRLSFALRSVVPFSHLGPWPPFPCAPYSTMLASVPPQSPVPATCVCLPATCGGLNLGRAPESVSGIAPSLSSGALSSAKTTLQYCLVWAASSNTGTKLGSPQHSRTEQQGTMSLGCGVPGWRLALWAWPPRSLPASAESRPFPYQESFRPCHGPACHPHELEARPLLRDH